MIANDEELLEIATEMARETDDDFVFVTSNEKVVEGENIGFLSFYASCDTAAETAAMLREFADAIEGATEPAYDVSQVN